MTRVSNDQASVADRLLTLIAADDPALDDAAHIVVLRCSDGSDLRYFGPFPSRAAAVAAADSIEAELGAAAGLDAHAVPLFGA